eukprot:9324612-Ditylum_brightwellii.AAC.1
MSLFQGKDVKKAIRASVLSAKMIKTGSLAKDAAKQSGSAPYVTPKRQPPTNKSLRQYGNQMGTNNVAKEATIQPVDSRMSRAELGSHANMPCMGREALVVSDTGRLMEVNPFMPNYDATKVRLVDAALKYGYHFTDKTYILLVRNVLHVPSMDYNLLPPFVLREARIRVYANPTEDDHAITFPGKGLTITLGLWGVFSYFSTSKPLIEE